MGLCRHIVLMASYNEWMNTKLYEAAARLSHAELVADRGAFFGSLMGTLNHIVVADTIWLMRFTEHPSAHRALAPVQALAVPTSLDQIVFDDIDLLAERRALLDAVIRRWATSLTEPDLKHVLEYKNTKGVVGRREFGALIMHFFNHQTHHRGQATTLLHQAGQDLGVTDLLMLIPNEVDGLDPNHSLPSSIQYPTETNR